MTVTVFVSYRRESGSGSAGRLYDALTDRFGKNAVFLDVDDIQPSDDFVEVINRTLAACRALVVVIDREWLSARDQHGRRRLDHPEDLVRIEIESALRSGIRIFPVLVDDAGMPSAGELPGPIAVLARRHAIELSATRFRHDAGRLIDAITAVTAGPTGTGPIPSTRRPRRSQPYPTRCGHPPASRRPSTSRRLRSGHPCTETERARMSDVPRR